MSATCPRCGLARQPGMRFCGGCGLRLDDADGDSGAPAERPERAQHRHMTVMFCDLVGSTPLAEALDPEDLHDVIGRYQNACATAVERFDGHISKFTGDGMLVYFGYPRAHEDDAARAVHAGLAILDEVAAVNVDLTERHDVALHVRVGIHSGSVIAGELRGGATREEFAILGETPNIASRLESAADPDTVAVSDATLALVEGFFETKPLVGRQLKGVSRDVHIYTVLAPTRVTNRVDTAARALPMVGRATELSQLIDAWTVVRERAGAVAHVSGEPGIGKSRFVRAVEDVLGSDVGVVQLWQCSSYHQNTALFPVVDYLERSLSLDVVGDPAAAQSVLETAAAGARLDSGEAALVAALLSIPGTEALRPDAAPLDVRAATMRALEALLFADAAQHPLLLIVEDLQWADPTTLELLERLVRRVRSEPILAVFTFRADFRPPWTGDDSVLDLGLRPLTADEVASMVSSRAGGSVDERIVRGVLQAADGVPLFVEEMVKMMSSGTSPDALTVPPTLRGLLTERLDRLPQLREVVEASAVIGRGITPAVLDDLDGLQDGAPRAQLTALVEHGILRQTTEAAGERYEFVHSLLQETAYGSVLRSRRRQLHRQVAHALIRRMPTTAEREPEVVARHLALGGEPASAVSYWHAAGLRSLERAAYIEAAGHFEEAIGALDASGATDHAERAEFLGHLAASLQAGRGYAAAGIDDAYHRARVACTSAVHSDRLVSVIRGEWLFHHVRADYAAALDRADEMLEHGMRTSRPDTLAEGHLFRGMVHMYRGHLDLARRDLEDAFAHYRPHRPDRVYEAQGDAGVMALAYAAPVLLHLGAMDDSMERSDASLALAEKIGGPITRAQAWGMRMLLHLGRKDAFDVSPWVERTRAHSIEHNLPYWRSLSELVAGWLRGRAGDLVGGIRQMEAELSAYLDSGARLGLPLIRALLADLRMLADDYDGALADVADAEAFIAETGEHFNEVAVLHAKARALTHRHTPDPAGAHAALVQALDLARAQHATLLALRAAGMLTRHELATDAPLTVLDELAQLSECFRADSTLVDVVSARDVLTRVRAPA